MPPQLLLLVQICTKAFVGYRFAPDPTGGAYSAPPGPLAGFRGGATSKTREDREMGERERGREGKGRGEREGGK